MTIDRDEFLKQYFQTLIAWVFSEGVRIERVCIRTIDPADPESAPVVYVVAHSSLSRKKIQGSYGKLMTKIANARDYFCCDIILSIHPEAEVLSTIATPPPESEATPPPASGDSGTDRVFESDETEATDVE